ncbi:MAG TPA: HAMP domain-containing sensor histidine kinase [Geobacteraceae bacterium]|nr:HAMP domain-containing sensor histidine kinase [Geobacteraceae bacterium]
MKWLKRLFHPLIAFIGIQLVWGVIVLFWISWFLDSNREFRNLALRYRPELVHKGLDWPALLGGIILLLVVLAGVYVLFLYWKRQYDLYRQQKNIISQVTHELKSPLASIQLHLETIRLRPLPPEKTEQFLDTMLTDVDRLNNLISNLLMAAKLEHRRRSKQRKPIDFSAFLSAYLERKQEKLPEGSCLSLDIEENIVVSCNPEEMEMALRNLFENAVLYSPGSPEIAITLRKGGKRCFLTFQDKGKGIDPEHLKKIFRMFYRVRSHGESIKGTGLGLYIVKSVINAHGGKIRVTSEGGGRGSTFHISLPLAEKP